MARMRASEVAAIVLAAGEGRRMGGRPKALLRLPDGTSFLERILATARAAALGRVLVVHAPGAALPLPAGVEAVVNPDPSRGMLSSIYAALDVLVGSTAAGALVWPVDCPRVPVAGIEAILAAAGSGAPVVVPRYAGRRGHPVLFAASVFAELRAAPLDQGARVVVRAHASDLAEVEVPFPEVLDDFDTPGDLEAIERGRG